MNIDFKAIAKLIPVMKSDWDNEFLLQALALTARPDCTSRQFGAVLVNEHKHQIAAGYNAPPHGIKSAAEVYLEQNLGAEFVPRSACFKIQAANGQYVKDAGYDACPAIHAEANAILFYGVERLQNMKGVKLYLAGRSGQTGELINAKPCIHCARLILQSKIEQIIYLDANGNKQNMHPSELKIVPSGVL